MNALTPMKVVLPGLTLVFVLTHMLPTCKKTAKNLVICAQMDIVLPLLAKRARETVAWIQNVKDHLFVDK